MPNNFYSAAASAAHCDEKKFTLQTGAAKLPAPRNSAGSSLRAEFVVHCKTNCLAPHQSHAVPARSAAPTQTALAARAGPLCDALHCLTHARRGSAQRNTEVALAIHAVNRAGRHRHAGLFE